MATSQNGWRAGSRAELGITTYTVPGTSVRLPLLPGPAATVLLEVARRFHAEVEALNPTGVQWCWGFAARLIRGSETTLSNHASGTAIDLNAPRHPLGRRGTYSPAQVTAIHRILADLHQVVRWGGDYTGRPDEMHFEIDAGYDAVHAVATRITSGALGSRIPTLDPPEDELSAADVQQITDAIASALKTVRGDVGYVRDQIRGDIGVVRDQVRGDVALVRDQIRSDITALPAAVLAATIPDPATGRKFTVADWLVYANLKAGTAADLTAALSGALADAGVPDPNSIAADVAARLTITTKEDTP